MDKAITLFQSKGIPVFKPGQVEYDHAIAISNLLFCSWRPDCVVQPETAAHVQTIIEEAKSKKLKITIKGNGLSYEGPSAAFKGISLDLRRMKGVLLDMKSKSVTIDAGCQWGDVYMTLISGGLRGYIINGARCPTAGVSGFILGGGLGPFTRSFGMGSDTLMEATLVTANGELVTVKETDDPKSDEGRLFWALCGAGGGNFGVLVKMKLRVQHLQNRYGMVVAGTYQWFPEEGLTDDVIATMNDFYTTDWPNKITIDSTWICDLRHNNSLGVRFTVAFDGSKPEYDRVINKYIKNEELKVQLQRRVLAEKSTHFLHETLMYQWLEETERTYPTNKTYKLHSSFVFKNDNKDTIKKVTAIIRDLMKDLRDNFKGEQVNFLVTWIHSGGKATEKTSTDSAFFWREAVFHSYVTVEWVDNRLERDMRRFLVEIKEALRPLSLNGEAAFINFPDRDLPTKSHESAYFGDNREELRRVKEIWDKDNFFRWVQGVRLPGDPEEDEEGDEDDDKTHHHAGEECEY
ncbi:FAD-binding domain-containing protein [Fusarium mundagurra]|uniref:FAD-binding domain-containing protein n=1 Tax=Fusarium mundagurra TaxID=1567541 RepID=A0A8H6CZX0_9HYPO|nr:FAD-binding domain-containing protein [Fusarium mundagurra]